MAKFTLYKDTAGYYRWRFLANNGRIVADSAEGYNNKTDCQNGINIVKVESPYATVDDQTLAATYR
jgi:uncharacterized protein YegP (UPF0339 family)